MLSNDKKLIAVVGATGQQGGGVVRALQTRGQFKVRALTRDPDKHRELAEEVVEADLDKPETLKAAFEGAHGVFLVTNFWAHGGTDELKQATAAIRAAKDAGVKHFIWSTLPDVEAISGGKFDVPHFTGKAKIDRVVQEAAFANHTFVIAPFYYGNLTGMMAPQKQADGSMGWALPLDPTRRVIHMGDINELGNMVAGAFAHPDEAGNGEYLPLVGDFMSFNEIVETLNRQGHNFSYKQVSKESFAGSFPGATEIAEMFSYWEAHTYLGSDSSDVIALANKVAGREPTRFSTWAEEHFPNISTPLTEHDTEIGKAF
ncbi:MAG TPA: NmrA/HSCARG family protein [Pyrinomonadaceae bacterium]